MKLIKLGAATLHYRIDGDPQGAPIVFANSLGTDFRLWDEIIPLLPEGLRILRFDKRGHGLSSCPAGNYSIGDLVTDTAQLMQALDFRNSLFVGLSIGGLIAQGLASHHSELVSSIIISNSAAKIGNEQMWQERMQTLRSGGIEALAENILERWFSKSFKINQPEALLGWRNMLTRTPVEGYLGCCAAIAATDFTQSTAELELPALLIAGEEDGSTPPQLVEGTADLLNNSQYELIKNAGHLPCVEQPEQYARILSDFIRKTAMI